MAEIYQYVRDGQMSPAFRPTLLDSKQDIHGCSEQLACLVRRCWTEDAIDRPDFSAVKATLKRINKWATVSARALFVLQSRHYVRCSFVIQGGPKKVSHYQESSLSRIKNRQCGYISHQFWVWNEHKNSISVYYFKYSMCDLICDVISCCVWNCNMGKINVYEKIVI